MDFTYEIIQLIAWPILIYISYRISMKMIDKFEKKVEASNNDKNEN